MKRDWDVIREVLMEVEAGEVPGGQYAPEEAATPQARLKARHAVLLWQAGYLSGDDIGTLNAPAFDEPELTWPGHELLDTIRSQSIWERVKASAAEKGIELTFDALKQLVPLAIAAALGGS